MFLGREISRPKNHGEEISKMIDQEIKEFIFTAEKNADELLKEKNQELHYLAQALLDYETINDKQLPIVLKGEPLDELDDNDSKEKTPSKKRKRRTASTKN